MWHSEQCIPFALWHSEERIRPALRLWWNLGAFTAAVPGARPHLVGARGLSLEQVLSLVAPELLAD